MFGSVSTVTYQVTASDMPGVYEITGIMLTGVGTTEPVLGDTQITVALMPEVTVPLWDQTFDEGSSGTYAVRLGQQPTADVTVAISSDEADVTVAPSSLTFTSANWNSRQTVTMNGAQDTDDNYDTAIGDPYRDLHRPQLQRHLGRQRGRHRHRRRCDGDVRGGDVRGQRGRAGDCDADPERGPLC